VIAHARDARPGECCGLLIGGPGRILETRRAANLAESPTRFLLDPRTHLEALRDSRRGGLDVVGFYHSHPHSPAVPSATDLAEATYGEYRHLIVSLASTVPETRLFELGQGQFVELPLDTETP
jgi:proteasome lid subunit RPN8/RPN11